MKMSKSTNQISPTCSESLFAVSSSIFRGCDVISNLSGEVASGNCESVDIASTCTSIPDVSEYLSAEDSKLVLQTCGEDSSFILNGTEEIIGESEDDISQKHFMESSVLDSTDTSSYIQDSSQYTWGSHSLHVDIKPEVTVKSGNVHCDSKDFDISKTKEPLVIEVLKVPESKNRASLLGTSLIGLKTEPAEVKLPIRPTDYVATSGQVGNVKLVTSNGRQYLTYHTPGDNINILYPISSPQGTIKNVNLVATAPGVSPSFFDEISTGSNVEVETHVPMSAVRLAKKRQRDRHYRKVRRTNPDLKAIDGERMKTFMQRKRSDEAYRAAEREKDRIRRAEARKRNKSLRDKEKVRDREYQKARQSQTRRKTIRNKQEEEMTVSREQEVQQHISENFSFPVTQMRLPVAAQEEEVVSTISDDLAISRDVTISDGVIISDAVTTAMCDDVTMNGDVTHIDDVTMCSDVTISDDITIGDDVITCGDDVTIPMPDDIIVAPNIDL